MRFLSGNAQHIGTRRTQEDSFAFGDSEDPAFLSHAGFLAVVCDGMGGMEHGELASQTALRVFLDAYRMKNPGESIPAALERSVLEANREVVSLGRRLEALEGIGTTLIAVALRPNSAYFISVGDSGIFGISGGELKMLNQPHIFARQLDAAVATGAMSRQDADAHPERESLTSYIGAEMLEEIDRNLDPLPIEAGDTILLASDGLFKTLSASEMHECLQGDPQTWPKLLLDCTLQKKREYQDNVTVLSVTAEASDADAGPPGRTRPRIPWLFLLILLGVTAGIVIWRYWKNGQK